jgi:hypothetical protein
MNLPAAIEAFNESHPKIVLKRGRDGRVTAILLPVGREIIVEGS